MTIRRIYFWIIINLMIFVLPVFFEMPLIVFLTSFLKNMLQPFYIYGVIFILIYGMVKGWKSQNKKCICSCSIVLIMIVFFSYFPFFNNYIHETVDLLGEISINLLVASVFIPFITNTGVVEFIAGKLEKSIRFIFKLPGEATVSIITGFVSAPSVGIFLAKKFYDEGIYDRREEIGVITNFSVVSIGFMGFVINTASLDNFYGIIIGAVFIINLLIAFITMRIPPICRIPCSAGKRVKEENVLVVRKTSIKLHDLIDSVKDTIGYLIEMFSQIAISYMVVMFIVDYTNLLEICSIPIKIFLDIFKINGSEILAQTLILGGIDTSLPAVYMYHSNISEIIRFKVIVLSIVQIIFYTEPVIAMRKGNSPIEWKYIIFLLIERSLLGLFLIECCTKIIF